MSIRSTISSLLSKLGFSPRKNKTVYFNCIDCNIWQRCGRGPDEDCIERAAQIERIAKDPTLWKHRPAYFNETI